MDDERHEECADTPTPATPHGLAQLTPVVDVGEPTTLAQNIATWHQMRALLTAYITEHQGHQDGPEVGTD